MCTQNKRYILATPRGFCAGVDRAIDIVELALEAYGSPVYVKHAIVHNTHVLRRLEKKGARFTDDLLEIPTGSHVVFSAHGTAPDVFAQAKKRNLHIIDATCPLVAKVHLEVAYFSKKGYDIIMVGHKGHVEPIGTLGFAKGVETRLIESTEDAKLVEVSNPDALAVVTQTTLSVDETKDVIDILRARFPHAEFPKKQDICYATTNRQEAVKHMIPHIDMLLVVGSKTSSNSNRLREVGTAAGVPSFLIDDASELQDAWISEANSIGITSGASVPDDLVFEVAHALKQRGFEQDRIRGLRDEDVHFSLPHEFVKDIQQASGGSDIIKKHAIQSGQKMRV